MSEIKRVSAQVTTLVEAEKERTETIQQIMARLETVEAQLSALKGGGTGIGGFQAGKASTGGTSQGVANNHPSLKVSDRLTSPKTLCSSAFGRLLST